MTINDYLNLITSEFREQPNFTSTVSVLVSIPVQIQNLLLQMIPLFDVDIAVGDQLDIIGQWVGISRNVNIPITGVFFTWDGAANVGWDFGIWQASNQPTQVTVLPDDSYRVLVKAKIAANQWDGTIEGAYAIWDSIFTQYTILIQDNQDMTYDLIILGGIVDSLTVALITGGYIPLKPEGVRVKEYFISTTTNKGFAWDLETPYLAGWNEGYWLQEISPT